MEKSIKQNFKSLLHHHGRSSNRPSGLGTNPVFNSDLRFLLKVKWKLFLPRSLSSVSLFQDFLGKQRSFHYSSSDLYCLGHSTRPPFSAFKGPVISSTWWWFWGAATMYMEEKLYGFSQEQALLVPRSPGRAGSSQEKLGWGHSECGKKWTDKKEASQRKQGKGKKGSSQEGTVLGADTQGVLPNE